MLRQRDVVGGVTSADGKPQCCIWNLLGKQKELETACWKGKQIITVLRVIVNAKMHQQVAVSTSEM
jgi:hypothetical protein